VVRESVGIARMQQLKGDSLRQKKGSRMQSEKEEHAGMQECRKESENNEEMGL